ncbi:hypothetical protein ES707_01395 [subsurface metagenome]
MTSGKPLSSETKREIDRLLDQGLIQKVVAIRTGVSKFAIYRIQKNRRASHKGGVTQQT